MYRILIVEDEPPIARYLCRLLEEFQETFEVAATGGNGLEGLELYEEYRPDVVITDVRMPMMNGLEMIHRIKKADPDAQFLIISDYRDFEYARDGLQLGVYNYLIKPVTKEQLKENLKQLEEILEQNRLENGQKALQSILRGELEGDAVKRLKNTVSKYQLVLLQKGCVLNSRMKYLVQAEEQGGVTYEEAEQMLPDPSRAAAWCLAGDSNVLAVLWDAGTGPVQLNMLEKQEGEGYWTAVCSEIFTDLKAAASCCSACRKILYYRTIIGKSQTLPGWKPQPQGELTRAASIRAAELIQAMKMNSFEQLKNEIIHCFDEMEQEEIPQYLVEAGLQKILQLTAEKRSITAELQDTSTAEIIFLSKSMTEVLGGFLDMLMMGWDFGEKNEGGKKKGQGVMENIEQYIGAHLNEVFSLQDISSVFGYSQTYICRLFRNYQNTSFKDYVTGRKIDKARELLSAGESVGAVSEYLGYLDQFYFSKVFKKRTGMNPSEYRKKAEEEK